MEIYTVNNFYTDVLDKLRERPEVNAYRSSHFLEMLETLDGNTFPRYVSIYVHQFPPSYARTGVTWETNLVIDDMLVTFNDDPEFGREIAEFVKNAYFTYIRKFENLGFDIRPYFLDFQMNGGNVWYEFRNDERIGLVDYIVIP